MGLFFWKGIEASTFRERPDGDWDFFPNGVMGRGYRVNAEQRAELQQMLRRQYTSIGIVLLPVIIIQAFFHSLLGKALVAVAALAVLTPFFLAFRTQRRRIIGTAPGAERRLTMGEVQQAAAEHMPRGRVIFLLILGPVMTLMGLFVTWTGLRDGDIEELLIGIFSLLFFGFCSWMGVRMWRKRQNFLAAGGRVPRVFD